MSMRDSFGSPTSPHEPYPRRRHPGGRPALRRAHATERTMIARVAGASLLLVGAFLSSSIGCSATPPGENLGVDHSLDTGNSGYCRTTTCQPPAEYPLGSQCEPLGWSDSETCRKKKNASNAPVWWRSACIGY